MVRRKVEVCEIVTFVVLKIGGSRGRGDSLFPARQGCEIGVGG